uniref:Uncharacterized protein n=1 Tax=Globodera rostochiensis TaxID=31243 RepID=A0A914HAF8_GLORO
MMAEERKREGDAEFLRIIGADGASTVNKKSKWKDVQSDRSENERKERSRAEEFVQKYKKSLLLPSTFEGAKELLREWREVMPNTVRKCAKFGLLFGGAIGVANSVLVSVLIGVNFGVMLGTVTALQTNYLNRKSLLISADIILLHCELPIENKKNDHGHAIGYHG